MDSPKKDIDNVQYIEEEDKAGFVDLDPATNRLALAQAMSPEEFAAAEKRLKRKLDLRLLLVVWIIFIMNYIDRVRFLTSIVVMAWY